MKAPGFWTEEGITATLLSPVGALFGVFGRWRWRFASPVRAGIPVVCVGNLVAGGAGKTPVALSFAALLQQKGHATHFLSRGYGGTIRGPHRVDRRCDSPTTVGDEALLLAVVSPTWVSVDRVAGVRAAAQAGAEIVVMDDGFQNPSIGKDFSIIVISDEQEFGNKRVMPSGPLRESIRRGFSRTNVVVVIGQISSKLQDLIPPKIPIFKAIFEIKKYNEIFKGKNVTAFAGIAYPNKFFKTLEDQGAKVIEKISYPDHYIYNENDLLSLAETANKTKSILVSTQKDYIRIPKSYRSLVNTLEGEIIFKNEELLIEILSNVIENYILVQ